MNSIFQGLLQKFFLQRMINQKNSSPETIKSYRDTFRLYIHYLKNVHECPPHQIGMKHIEAEFIIGFLEYLRDERKNQPTTINNRLAAIHAFLHFISFEKPSIVLLFKEVLWYRSRRLKKGRWTFLQKKKSIVCWMPAP